MTEDDLKAVIMKTWAAIAPETEGQEINPDVNFRDQFDFDSMDFLNFVITLQKELGVEIAEIDYPKFSSLTGCVSYLTAKLDAAAKA